MVRRDFAFFVVALCLGFPIGNAATIIVDPQGGGDFREIQPALDAALEGDTVFVEPGTYVVAQTIDFNRLHDPQDPASPRVKQLSLRSRAGPEETRIVLADGAKGSVIVFRSGETRESVLEGFTITGGSGCAPQVVPDARSGDGPPGCVFYGGGVSCEGSSPTVRSCVLAENWGWEGGGLNVVEGAPLIERCVFLHNGASSGGGIHALLGSPTITDCTIIGNEAEIGGGIDVQGGSARIIRCAILGNEATMVGGGASVCGSALLLNCIFAANRAIDMSGFRGQGGGIWVFGPTARIVNSTISSNRAEIGGGIRVLWTGSARLTHTIVSGNEASIGPDAAVGDTPDGGGPTLVLEKCLLGPGRESISIERGATIEWIDSIEGGPTFRNPGIFDFSRYTAVVFTSVSWLPDFIVEMPDYRLLPGSLGIDIGDCEGAAAHDFDGNARPAGGGCDAGAYELDGMPAPRFIRGDANGDGAVSISDSVFLLHALFGGVRPLRCPKAGDYDDNGHLTLGDAILGLNHLFQDGPAPWPPFPGCGWDLMADDLDCDPPPACK